VEGRRIVKYNIGWAPGPNQPVAVLDLEDGTRHQVPVESAAELAALAAILGRAPGFVYANGVIGTTQVPES
jgi:hypothetical protein